MNNTEIADLMIRLGVGITQVVFGLSQQRSPEAWLGYIPRPLRYIMPIKPTTFMRIHSLGNIGLGAWLVSGLAQPAAVWCSLLWWAWILPFAFYRALAIGMRDFTIIIALIALLTLL